MTKNGIKAGDSIRLNDLARPYFRDVDLQVDEVKSWGVKCHYTDAQGGQYYYRAEWEEIRGLLG